MRWGRKPSRFLPCEFHVHGMLHILAILLLVVVGDGIQPIAVGMVLRGRPSAEQMTTIGSDQIRGGGGAASPGTLVPRMGGKRRTTDEESEEQGEKTGGIAGWINNSWGRDIPDGHSRSSACRLPT